MINFFISSHWSTIENLISVRSARAFKYCGTGRFIDGICAINDWNEFSKSKRTYIENETLMPSSLLSWTLHHYWGWVFIYKLYNKSFPSSWLECEIYLVASFLFYGPFYSELLRNSRGTLLFSDFIPKASKLYYWMVVKGGIIKQLQKKLKNVPQIHNGFKQI